MDKLLSYMAGLTLRQLWLATACVSVKKEWANWYMLQRASLMADLEHGIMQAGVLEGDQGCLGYPHRDASQVQGLAGEHQLALRQQGLQAHLPYHTVTPHHLQPHAALHPITHTHSSLTQCFMLFCFSPFPL